MMLISYKKIPVPRLQMKSAARKETRFGLAFAPDLAGRDFGCFCVELQGVNCHQRFSIGCQVPFDDQLALFSFFGFDLMSLYELLVVLRPDGCSVDGSRS